MRRVAERPTLQRASWVVRLACLCTACAAIGAHAAPRSTEPSKPDQDRWLSAVAIDELSRCVQNRTAGRDRYDQLATRIDTIILGRLACGGLRNLDALGDLVYVRRACRVLATACRIPRGDSLADWLMANPNVARVLYHAMETSARPAELILSRLQALIAAEPNAVIEYTQLAVAFAVAQPMRHYRDQPNPCTEVEAFRWFTRSGRQFRCNLRTLPWELAVFLANSRLSLPERVWAYDHHTNMGKPARAFFNLDYDTGSFKRGDAKKIADCPYTLQNLNAIGGVCIEQAYYASEICKALGLPAAIVSGRGESGVGHAWVACFELSPGGRRAAWDCTTGRYASHKYYTGLVTDPVRSQRIPDAELMLIGAAAKLPPKRRDTADTAAALAAITCSIDKTIEVDLAILRALAELHDTRLSDGATRHDRAVVTWISPTGTLSPTVTWELLATALDQNVTHRGAWDLIVRSADRMPPDRLMRFCDLLITRTGKTYPDISCAIVMQIVPGLDDPAMRQRLYKRASTTYAKRPDLLGAMLLQLADEYQAQGDTRKTLRILERAAVRSVDVPGVVVEATRRAETILLAGGHRNAAISLYEKLFAKTTPKNASDGFKRQTVHQQLGQRLATLLEQAGRTDAARRVRLQIAPQPKSSTD